MYFDMRVILFVIISNRNSQLFRRDWVIWMVFLNANVINVTLQLMVFYRILQLYFVYNYVTCLPSLIGTVHRYAVPHQLLFSNPMFCTNNMYCNEQYFPLK